MDSSWDNSGLPPQRKGMPTWLKVMAGCGIAVVLLIGSCVGFAAWGIHKVADLGKAQWPTYVQTVKELQYPLTTKAVYEASPALQKEYSDEAAFENQVSEWRPGIQTPPEVMPSITTGRVMSFQGRNHRMNMGNASSNSPEGSVNAVSGYRMDDGRMLVIAWQDGKVMEIQFDKKRSR